MLSEIRPHWNDAINLDVESKFSFLASQGFNVHLNEIFPSLALSRGIEPMEFFRSMFVQPDLFVRIRPGLKEKVLSDLKSTGIEYRFIEPRSVAFPNSVRLQDHLILDREVVVQDLSSQETWNFIPQFEKSGKVWDCCAASGGKSFLIKDKLGNVSLLVSDIRSSILANLGKRFRTAGLTNFEVKQLDLRNPGNVSPEAFDLVVADVPCTGSGTWSRTPEQLYFFKEDSVKEFRQLQTTIAGNIVQAVKPGGYLLYITCSVFYGENEGVVDDLTRNAKLELLRQETIRGYNDKADTMFASLLQKVRAV